MVFFYGIVFLLLFVFAIYFFPSHKFFSRAHYLVLLGFSICIFAAIINDISELFQTFFPDKDLSRNIDLMQQISSFSIASLGGGIIASGFMIKVQIEHNNEQTNLEIIEKLKK